MAVLVLVALLAVFLSSASPASATRVGGNEDDKSASLVYLTTSGYVLSCTVTDRSNHNTDRNDVYADVEITGDAGCRAEAYTSLEMDFVDQGRKTHTLHGDATGGLALQSDGAYAPVHTRADVSFLDCDGQHSSSCGVTVTTAPK